MMITPLQDYLQREVISPADIQQSTGRSRVTIWRWRTGECQPDRENAAQLIQLFSGRGFNLDFNGCYEATVFVPGAKLAP